MNSEVAGKTVQVDYSGVGHCWRDADMDTLPENIREEIAAEIIDGSVDECRDYRASNGLSYRWR